MKPRTTSNPDMHKTVKRVALAFGCGVLIGLTVIAIRWVSRTRMKQRSYAPAPVGMVFVPPGPFLMGSDDPDASDDERPLRSVFLKAFYIDASEVTNEDFRKVFPEHPVRSGEEDLPVTRVYKWQAEQYCRAVGKRLPTSAEWEKAARGTDGRRYPWGNEYRDGVANLKPDGEPDETTPSATAGLPQDGEKIDCALLAGGKVAGGQFPESDSPYGAHDMAGNVWEWVADEHSDRSLFTPGAVKRGILRGGAYGYGAFQARCSYQAFEGLESTCNDTGFRCAMDAEPGRSQ